jgi:hypothetical protein
MNNKESIAILERDIDRFKDADYKQALSHAIEVLKASEWQPIETAPVGIPVLLCGGTTTETYVDEDDGTIHTFDDDPFYKRPATAYFKYYDSKHLDDKDDDHPRGRWIMGFYDCACKIEYHNPTHWMLLPKEGE